MTAATSPGLRTVIARPGYRRLWAARTISQVGDIAQFTTVALLAFHLTASGLGVSAVVIAEILPVLLLGPVAGPLVDRLPRVAVMIGADLVRLCLAGLLALWHSDIMVVYAVAVGLSAAGVFFNPAANSLLPALVDDDELVAANSGIWSAAVLAQVLLAPVAGLVATTAGFGWGFAVNAASFGLSALALRGLRAKERAPSVARATMWSLNAETVRVLTRDRLLRTLAIAQALAALSAGATSALLVVLAAEHLHIAGGGYGLMLAAIAAGALCGPVLLSRFAAHVRGPRAVYGAFGLRGGVDVVLAAIAWVPAALGALVLYGIGTSVGTISFTSLLQSYVPGGLRGRVFGAFELIWQAMRLVSLVVGGIAADAVGVPVVFYAAGVLLLAAALAGLIGTSGRLKPAGRPRPAA